MTTPQPERPAVVTLPARTPCPLCAGGGPITVHPRGEANLAQPQERHP